MITFYYGTMNAGKTLHALVKAFNLKERGFKVKLLKPAIDTRTSYIILEKGCPHVNLIKNKSIICFQDEMLKQQAYKHGKAQQWGISGKVKQKLMDPRYSYKTVVIPQSEPTTQTCSKCGIIIDRDVNAALNMILFANIKGLDEFSIRVLTSYQNGVRPEVKFSTGKK